MVLGGSQYDAAGAAGQGRVISNFLYRRLPPPWWPCSAATATPSAKLSGPLKAPHNIRPRRVVSIFLDGPPRTWKRPVVWINVPGPMHVMST